MPLLRSEVMNRGGEKRYQAFAALDGVLRWWGHQRGEQRKKFIPVRHENWRAQAGEFARRAPQGAPTKSDKAARGPARRRGARAPKGC